MDTKDDPSALAFVTWPMQSPTSRLGINIRYYSIDDDGGARYHIDLGAAHEALLERLYADFNLWGRDITTKQFEETIRGLFQQRGAFINAYGIATTLYVAFTTDPGEMSRLIRREQRVLASQRRRYPYTVYSQYQDRPPTLWGQVKWFFGGLGARLFRC